MTPGLTIGPDGYVEVRAILKLRDCDGNTEADVQAVVARSNKFCIEKFPGASGDPALHIRSDTSRSC